MRLLFLGTGAADWNIEKKAEYLETRGEFRRFSSTLIDDTLLIDPGPHIFDFAQEQNTPTLYARVSQVLITHSHADHFSPETVRTLSEQTGCTFYGDGAAYRKLVDTLGEETVARIRFCEVGLTETFSCGEYRVTSFHSNHGTADPDEKTRNYSILAPDGKKLFYGLDSGPFRFETWESLRGAGFDGMVLECTTGDVIGDDRIYGHSSLPWVLYSLNTLRKSGTVKPEGKIWIDHMARTLHEPQQKLVSRLRESGSGMIAAYDGMRDLL